MTGRFLSAALMLSALGACSEPAEDVVVDDPRSSEPAADLVDQDNNTSPMKFAPSVEAADAREFTTQFPILDTRDIITVIPVDREPGIFFLQVDIFQPSGTPYETIWRAYSSDADAPETVTHPTLNIEIAVMKLRPGDPPRLYLGIAVAGTQITQFALTGVFRVEARFGMADDPVAFQSSFEILMAIGT